VNAEVCRRYVDLLGGTTAVLIRPLLGSVSSAIGTRFRGAFEEAVNIVRDRILGDLARQCGTQDLARMCLLVDLIPDEGYRALDVSSEAARLLREEVKTPPDLQKCPPLVFGYVLAVASCMGALMSLRPLAKAAVILESRDADFPEFGRPALWAGITRREGRLSLLPHNIRYRGQTLNPMHGLALYEKTKYRGVVPYAVLKRNASVSLLTLGAKRVGAIM
jgi:hypothetical protein